MTRGHMLIPRNSTLNASWTITEKIPNSNLTRSALVLVDSKHGVDFKCNANFLLRSICPGTLQSSSTNSILTLFAFMDRSPPRWCLRLDIRCNVTCSVWYLQGCRARYWDHPWSWPYIRHGLVCCASYHIRGAGFDRRTPSHPKPFKCSIKPRSAKAIALIQQDVNY
jgi:hypothetical protein